MARTSGSDSGPADSAGMAAHEVELELLHLLGRNVDVGELAEAGADAIDDGVLPNDLFDDPARSVDRVVRARGDLDRLARIRDTSDFGKRKRPAVDLQHAPRLRQNLRPGNTPLERKRPGRVSGLALG